MEYMDFFDALRIVIGSKRAMRYKKGPWSEYKFDGRARSFMLIPRVNNPVLWWPTFEQQKEKVWQVEPEPEELFSFAEAFAAALDGAEIAPEDNEEDWSTYHRWENKTDTCGVLIIKTGRAWWPIYEQIKGKWRVKRKSVEEKEVFVWGVCDEKEKSRIYANKEAAKVLGENHAVILPKNLFPKDKPQKFILKKV